MDSAFAPYTWRQNNNAAAKQIFLITLLFDLGVGKDSASESHENLFSDGRVQPILCKDSEKPTNGVEVSPFCYELQQKKNARHALCTSGVDNYYMTGVLPPTLTELVAKGELTIGCIDRDRFLTNHLLGQDSLTQLVEHVVLANAKSWRLKKTRPWNCLNR